MMSRAVLVVILSVVALAVATAHAQVPYVIVPPMMGLQYNQALLVLEHSRLRIGQVNQQPTDAASPGTVLGQNPLAGARVPAGTLVNLVVAVPVPLVTVPNVTGATAGQAMAVLRGTRLGWRFIQQPGTPAGTIFAQDIAAGTRVRAGTIVTLTVAVEDMTVVPNVVSMTSSQATATLQNARLGWRFIQQPGTPVGTILAQEPLAGARVAPRTVVTLTVAVEDRVRVPNVVGLTPDQAAARLQEVRLSSRITRQPGTPVGTIISQDPAAGTLAAPGTNVTIVLAVEEDLVSVPDVVSLTPNQATATLQNVRLEWRFIRQPGSPVGTIILQDPAAGARVRPGSVITLTLATQDLVRVPNVVSMAPDQAASRLQESRLGSRLTRRPGAPAGTVIAQEPQAGTQVPPGTVVTVTVAVAATPRPFIVPNVVGMTLDQATSTLRDAHLSSRVTRRPGTPAGTVIDQTPREGAQVPANSAVALVVAVGATPGPVTTTPRAVTPTARPVVATPQPVVVPHVVGLSFEPAAARLQNEQLRVGQVSRRQTDAARVGMVLAQRPQGGSQVVRGTAVNLVVAEAVIRPPVSVPNVVGMNLDEATSTLRRVRLSWQVTERTGSPVRTVLEQNPAAGTRVPPRSVVNLVVAVPIPPVSVPGVVGLPRDQAIGILRGVGLRWQITEQPGAPPQTVLAQTPAAEAQVPPETVVSLVVAARSVPWGWILAGTLAAFAGYVGLQALRNIPKPSPHTFRVRRRVDHGSKQVQSLETEQRGHEVRLRPIRDRGNQDIDVRDESLIIEERSDHE